MQFQSPNINNLKIVILLSKFHSKCAGLCEETDTQKNTWNDCEDGTGIRNG
jgi:hypothetical protein